MAITLLLDKPLPSSLIATVSPLAELACALHANLNPTHHPHSQRLSKEFEAMSDGVIAIVEDTWWPLFGAFKPRYFYPIDAKQVSLSQGIETLEGLAPDIFSAMTLQALAGDSNFFVSTSEIARLKVEQGGLKYQMRLASPAHHRLTEWLLDNPAEVQRALAGCLRRVAEQGFSDTWDAILPSLEHERRRAEALVRTDPWRVFYEMPLVSVDKEGGKVVFDKLYPARIALSQSPLLLIPTIHGAPHIAIKHYPGYLNIVHYPILDTQRDPGQTISTIRSRLEAINHPTRITICRELLRRPSSTTELAYRLNMTVPQTSRHLRQLREAGLAVRSRQGLTVNYELDLKAIRRIGADVLDMLLNH
jgi:DNA-binding transcriptional ArsR family regulator